MDYTSEIGDKMDGLRKRISYLADDVIEKLVMECDTDEQYQRLVTSLLAEAPTQAAMDTLREKLRILRQLVLEKENREKQRKPGMIDDTFLSIVFAVALVVILVAAIFAFQGLFSAMSRKVPVNVTRPLHKPS